MNSSKLQNFRVRHSLFAVALSAGSGLLFGCAVYSMWLYSFRSFVLLAFVTVFFGILGVALMLVSARIMGWLTGVESRGLEISEAMAVSALLSIYLSFIPSFLTLTFHYGREIPAVIFVFLLVNIFIFLSARRYRALLYSLVGVIIAGLVFGGVYTSRERIKYSPLPDVLSDKKHALFRIHHGYHTRTGLWLEVNQSIETGMEIPDEAHLRFEIGVVEPGRDLAPARLVVMARDSTGQVHRIHQAFINRQNAAWTTHETRLSGLAPGEAALQIQLYSTDERHENLKPLVLSNLAVFSKKGLAKVNVVILVLDALRADALGCYGSRDTHTPVMDRLASQGVLFEKATAPCSWTLPSVASILTSLLPSQHGLFNFMQSRIDRKITTLPEQLAKRGVFTKAIIGNWMIYYGMNFDKGFNDFYLEPLRRVFWRSTESLMNDSAEWIKSRPRGPFFAYIHNMDPHHPHLAPEPYSFRSRLKNGFQKLRAFIVLGFRTPYIYGVDLRAIYPFTDDEAEEMRGRYLGEVEYVDSQVAVIERTLKESGLWDDTLLIITSDHGEEFQEHGSFRHGQDLHREVIRVPLVFTGGIMEGRAGRITTPVSLLDLYPTIVELYGILAPAGIMGQSLWPVIEGVSGEGRVVYSELVEMVEQKHLLMSAVNGEYHLIKRVPLREQVAVERKLYRWDTDPGEEHDLSSIETDRVEEMERAMDEFFENLPGRKRLDVTFEEGLEEIKKRLKALGYLK